MILKTQVFLQLYSKLREMKLHPLVLKGPVCAVLYPKPELRLFSDVDLLAVSGEFDRTRNALLRLGCRTAGESVDPLEQTFYLPGSPLVLELHGNRFRAGRRNLYARRERDVFVPFVPQLKALSARRVRHPRGV